MVGEAVRLGPFCNKLRTSRREYTSGSIPTPYPHIEDQPLAERSFCVPVTPGTCPSSQSPDK